MFKIYQSNNIDILFLKICQILKKKCTLNIFKEEYFIHDNYVLFQYLKIFVANEIGIAANFKFDQANKFIWNLLKLTIKEKKIYNIHSMTWNIMNIIEENKDFENFYNFKSSRKKFQFSFIMAQTFKKYIIYRPKLIDSWENKKNQYIIDKNQKWQKKLWIEIKKYNQKIHNYNINYKQLIPKLEYLISIKKIILPNRIFIISSFLLNPLYVKIFKIIGKYTYVYFFNIKACKNNIFSHSIISDKKNKCQNKNNILIKLWGKYEKFYSFYIHSKKNKIINCFKTQTKKNLLNIIQNDILLSKNNKTKDKKRLLSKYDDSISINMAESKKDEIQLLYNKITKIFQENKDVLPGDIVVTSYSIDEYYIFIQSIFQKNIKNKNIPFFIADHNFKNDILLSAVNKILNLNNSRFSNIEILNLLDIPEIANKFNISEKEINILYHWIEKVHIRWAVNEKHQKNLSLIQNKTNTWFYGIDQLLLSYSTNQKNNIWNNTLSHQSTNGSHAELVGKLAYFIDTLNKWRKKISQPKKLKSWQSLFEDLIKNFFYKNIYTEKFLIILKNNWNNIIKEGISSQYKKKFLLMY